MVLCWPSSCSQVLNGKRLAEKMPLWQCSPLASAVAYPHPTGGTQLASDGAPGKVEGERDRDGDGDERAIPRRAGDCAVRAGPAGPHSSGAGVRRGEPLVPTRAGPAGSAPARRRGANCYGGRRCAHARGGQHDFRDFKGAFPFCPFLCTFLLRCLPASTPRPQLHGRR